jgi:hypothetical protein
MMEGELRCKLSPCPLLLSVVACCFSSAQAQTAQQQLDQIVAKYSGKPVDVAIAVPERLQVTVGNPGTMASADAMGEASLLCRSQGGAPVESRVVKNGSVKFILSLKCAHEGKALWYLDFEQQRAASIKKFSGNLLAFDVTLSLKRLMPSDLPQTPILSWRGVYRAGEEVDAVALDGQRGGMFGFRYSWRFAPQAVKQLELVWQPAAAIAGDMVNAPRFRKPLEIRDGCVEPRDCSANWTFDSPEEWTPGIWNLGLVADGIPVVSTAFLVRKNENRATQD